MMRFKLNTDYTAEERDFIARNDCVILSEIKLGGEGNMETITRGEITHEWRIN